MVRTITLDFVTSQANLDKKKLLLRLN